MLTQPLQLGGRQLLRFLDGHDPVFAVDVHRVKAEPVGDQDILEAVEIDVHEGRRPRPVARLEPGVVGHLQPGAVTPRHQQRVAVVARAVVKLANRSRDRFSLVEMNEPAHLLPGEHVEHQHVVVAVEVDVGKVDAHRRATRVAHGQPRHRPKPTAPVVYPKPVGVAEVVAYIQVRREVAVDIAERHGKSPVARGGKRLSVLAGEGALLEHHFLEPAGAVVQVKTVSLRQFPDEAARRHQKPVAEPRLEGGLPVDAGDHPLAIPPPQREPRARVGDVHHIDVIGHVQVEVAVAVHIGQREARGRVVPRQPGVGRLGKPAPAVIHEQPRAGGDAVDQQIGMAVAVDIGKRRPGGKLTGTTHAGRPGDVGELPAAEIPVQPVGSLQVGEVEIAQAVAVHVGGGHTRAVVGHGVGEEHLAKQPVGETQPGERRRQSFKTGWARSRDPERGAPVARAVVPGQVGRRETKRTQRQADEAGQAQCREGAPGQAWCRRRHAPHQAPNRSQGQRKSAAWPSGWRAHSPDHLASNAFSSASFTVTTISSLESPLRSASAMFRASPGTTRPDSLGQTG